jgi:hypothetical protein
VTPEGCGTGRGRSTSTCCWSATSSTSRIASLVELDPELALPDGTRLADALERLEGQRVERVGEL